MANETKTTHTHYVADDGLMYTSSGVLDARFDVTDVDKARRRFYQLQEQQAHENLRRANEFHARLKRIRKWDEGLQALLVVGACALLILTIFYVKQH